MISSPYAKYRQASVQTASPAQLLLMLYDGAIRFVKSGIDFLRKNEKQQANESFIRAQAIIAELRATLDPNFELSESLSKMYEYINFLLIEANMKKDSEKAEEALGYITELRETWSQAAKLAVGQSDG